MKFKSDPGRVVTDSKTHRAIGKFDEDGIFETEDPYYIEKLKLLFPVVGAGNGKPAAPKKDSKEKDAPKNRKLYPDAVPEKSGGLLGQKKVKA